MRGRLLALAYGLQNHHFGRWSLHGWLINLAAVAAVILALAALRDASPARWLAVAAPLALIAVLLVWQGWARRQAYVVFVSDPHAVAPVPAPLDPKDKVIIHATGLFEVEGSARFFAGLLAYWRSFASREHAVMAMANSSRFLLLGTLPERHVGLWYIFFCPEAIRSISAGEMTLAASHQPGLCVQYQTPEMSAYDRRNLPFWARNRRFSHVETVYLTFDDEAAREQVWADLLC